MPLWIMTDNYNMHPQNFLLYLPYQRATPADYVEKDTKDSKNTSNHPANHTRFTAIVAL